MTDTVTKTPGEKALDDIARGRTKMRPKSFFVVRAVLIGAGIVLVALVLLFSASFTIFALRYNGAWYAPSFGLAGIMPFLTSLPWVVALVGVGCIGLIEYLATAHSFAYRQPLLFSLLAVVGLVAAGGLLIARTPLHEGLFKRAQDATLPFAGEMYRRMDSRLPPTVHRGIVTEMLSEGFRMRNRHEETLMIILSSPERMMHPLPPILVGDVVVVLGQRRGDAVEAFGVRKLDFRKPESFRGRMRYVGMGR